MNTYWHREKLKELILYAITNTKREMDLWDLMNTLFLIDMQHFGQSGKSITGSKYIKTKRGVKIKGIETVIREMVHEKLIKILTKS